MYRLSFIIFYLLLYSYVSAQSPHGENFNRDCADCHDAVSWKLLKEQMNFNHNDTKFALIGQHKQLDCKQCHTTLVFEQSKQECFSCHKDIHKNSVSLDCSKCHTPESWIIKDINQLHQMSRFPLIGIHLAQDCQQCHTKFSELNFEVMGVTCYDCHAKEYLATQNPNHVQSGFSKDCQECHSLNSLTWSSANFSHDFFPLVGGHKISNCFSCHTQGGFKGLSKDCYVCHKTDFDATVNPNHGQAKFSTNCVECHNSNSWRPSTFNHSSTGFVLTGKHSAAQCSSCHSAGYSNTSPDCNSCHNKEYTATTNPNHIAANFPVACADCHNTNGWTPATFDHDAQFFPIYSGKHNGKWNNCSDCHTNQSNFSVFSCITCHEHNQTDMNNKHNGISGYSYNSTACFECHPTGSSEGAFNHSTSRFPLVGKHSSTPCESCHKSGYANTPMECVSCHQTDFNNSVNPNHSAVGISTNCSSCHNPNGWTPSSFSHSATAFALAGQHTSAKCEDCHKGQTSGTTQQCVGCHQVDFNNSINPNHTQAKFSTNCTECHNVNGWRPSTFNHSSTGFVLTGKHSTAQCSSCHSAGYSNTSPDCNSCHNKEYTATTNPNHTTAHFPVTCGDCHTTNGWTPATFDHDAQFFPIYSGKHNGKWNNCSDCHTNQSNFSAFSCITCHEHSNQTEVNNDHSEVNNYVYESNACYHCHPGGRLR